MSNNHNKKQPTSVRKLVAILFADIQGYTALMQTNEEKGSLILRKFSEELSEQVPLFNGQLVNFYGDGCLCTFENAVDAANCAIKVQNSFQHFDPKIPVRIGLHSGDVFFEADNAYGDNVNLTSRVESFAVPGSILISQRFQEDIKSNTGLESVSLGKFSLKNVKHRMQIYALKADGLIIPNPKDLKGKGESAIAAKMKSRNWKIAIFFFILSQLFLFSWLYKTFSDTGISEEIKESKIAVLPFENKTGLKDLDIVGDMAADWIIQGLMYLDDVHLVGFESIQENIKYAGVGDSSDNFAARTGAQKIVKGKYYLSGDKLIFQSQIIDAKSGQIELALPQVSGSKNDNAAVVSVLQQKFVTAFDAQHDDFSPGIAQNPPPHKAYQNFREGIEYYGVDYEKTRSLMNSAIEMDSSFFWPYIWITGSYFMQGEKSKADSAFGMIKQKIDLNSLTPFDRQWHTHWQALLNRDLEMAYESSLKILEKDPKQWFSNVEAGIMANDLNKPNDAVRIFEHLNPKHAPQNIELDTWWHNHYAHNLFRVQRYDDAINVVNYIQPKFRKFWNYYNRLAEVYAIQNEDENLQNLILEMEKNQLPEMEILQLMVFISERFGVQNEKEKKMAWAKKGIARIKDKTMEDYLMGCLYLSAEEYAKALTFFKKNIQENGNSWLALSRLGSTYGLLGNKEKANSILTQIEKLYAETKDAGYLIAQAHVQTSLGEKEKAVSLMQQAHKKGHAYSPSNYKNDIMFVSLNDFPPFEEFVAPK